ncbi:hypothetical protein ACUHMQ_18420, partial [Chitinimonas sp. PSY-7]|uniref:hypothetical protein n=1 Tax=Chitinimonas sp. PSY-7 TaxID=3459088 RepID=UPI00403FD020
TGTFQQWANGFKLFATDVAGVSGSHWASIAGLGLDEKTLNRFLGLATTVVINNNTPVIGTHAGVVVGSGKDAVLYDPGGSYRNKDKGSGDALYGREVNLDDYIRYQRKDGENVQAYTFPTTPEQEAIIKERIENNGSRGPGFCASDTSKAIDGIGPFKGLGASVTPRGLGRSLKGVR